MADTKTPNLGLTLPTPNVLDPVTDWATKLNGNFSILDAAYAPTALSQTANILINGGFEFWQRFITTSTLTNALYTADRWKIKSSGTAVTGTISKETSHLDRSPTAMKINITSVTGNTGFGVQQLIENSQDFAQKTIVLTARIAASVTGMQLYITDGFVAQSTPIANTGSGYASYTLSFTVSAATGTISIGFLSTGNGVTGTFYLDDFMLAVSPVPVPYIPLPYAQELVLCQRYYEKSCFDWTVGAASTTSTVFGSVGAPIGSTLVYFCVPFKVTKALNGAGGLTITMYNDAGASGHQTTIDSSDVQQNRAVSFTNCYVSVHGFSFTIGSSLEVYAEGNWTAEAEL